MHQYVEEVAAVIAQHGGRYGFVSDRAQAIQGAVRPVMLAAVEFADMDRLRAFWESPGNDAVKVLRHRGSRSGLIFVDAPSPV